MINNNETQIRKRNMKLYSIYRSISRDLIFFYATEFLFLTQVKSITASEIVLKASFYALFMVLFQIPANILTDKIGIKKSVVFGNIFGTIYLIMIMFAQDLKGLIIAEIFCALCFSIKDISDTTLLNMSVPDGKQKGDIFSKIEGKGSKNYYYINAITAVLSGFLYTINPYIPVIFATIISIFATILSFGFEEIDNENKIKQNSIKEYVIELKDSFKFITKSNRLRSLILYSGIMWGIFALVSTYRVSLLEDIGTSATWIAIIAAIVGIGTGIGSKYQLKLHNRFKNRTLSVISISMTMMVFLTGIVGITKLSPNIIMILVLVFNTIININKGMFEVLVTRYLSNFAHDKILPKIYSINAISRNVFRMIIGVLGSYLLGITNTAHAEILIGIIAAIITIALISYMKTRIGLKPEEYKKDEIKFDI